LQPLPAEDINIFLAVELAANPLLFIIEMERVTALIFIEIHLWLPWVRFVEIPTILYSFRMLRDRFLIKLHKKLKDIILNPSTL
jgi:hypothetical protein